MFETEEKIVIRHGRVGLFYMISALLHEVNEVVEAHIDNIRS